MPSAARYMVLLALAGTILALQDITALFNVDLSTSKEGGCQDIGSGRLNQLVRDCYTLASAGLQLMNDAQATALNQEATRLVDGFFQGNTLADRLEIANSYRAVQSFLDNAPLINGRRPWLFCNDGHVQPRQLNDMAQDNNGFYMDNVDGSHVYIRDLSYIVQGIRAAEQAGQGPQQPFIDTRLWQYDIDDALEWPATLCDNFDNQASTTDTGKPNIILCPKSFQRDNQNLREAEIFPNTLADIRSGKAHGNPPDDARDLASVAATLFHELFHLVLGGRNTPDAAYNVFDMLNLPVAEGKRNPETLTTVALAYDYTQNSERDDAGNLVEFYTGYATQG